MAQVYKKLEIDVNKEVTSIITAVQNDAKSRYLDVVLLDGSTAINLTGHEVRIYGKKADGTEFYNNGGITNATAGRCQLELTSQALAVANDLEVQIILFKSNVEILSTQPFKIHVVKSLFSSSAVTSSNEYGALVVLYQNLYEAYDLMTTMVQNFGEKGTISAERNISTYWQVAEYMAEYLDTDVMAKLQIAIDASKNAGAVIQDDALYLPKMKLVPLQASTPVSSVMLMVRFATSEKVYCSTSDYKVFIYDAKTMLKIGETAAQTGNCQSLYVADGKIYYSDAASRKVIMFDDSTYLKLGETAAQGGNVMSMFVSNGRLFCNVLVQTVSVFNSTTLSLLGNISVSPLANSNLFVYNDVLYVGTSSGIKLYNATTRVLIATVGSGTSRSNIFVSNGVIFATDYDTSATKVYMYDVVTRLKIGETAIPTSYCKYLFVEDGIVYVATVDGHAYRIDVATFTNMDGFFAIETGTNSVSVKDSNVYYPSLTSGDYRAIKLISSYQISHYEKRGLT